MITFHLFTWGVLAKGKVQELHSPTGRVSQGEVESGAKEARQEGIAERSLSRRLGGASSAIKKID